MDTSVNPYYERLREAKAQYPANGTERLQQLKRFETGYEKLEELANWITDSIRCDASCATKFLVCEHHQIQRVSTHISRILVDAKGNGWQLTLEGHLDSGGKAFAEFGKLGKWISENNQCGQVCEDQQLVCPHHPLRRIAKRILRIMEDALEIDRDEECVDEDEHGTNKWKNPSGWTPRSPSVETTSCVTPTSPIFSKGSPKGGSTSDWINKPGGWGEW